MWQINVPEECNNKTFDKLFKFLLKKDLVTLGLYRMTGATDNTYNYVYTNPVSKTSVTHRDRVFVLGKDIPPELIIDHSESNNSFSGGVQPGTPFQTENQINSSHKNLDQTDKVNIQTTQDFYGVKKDQAERAAS